MVHVSHAMLTATLALNAAAPILAAPLFSSPGGHGRLVGRPAPPEPPVREPAPPAAAPEPAPPVIPPAAAPEPAPEPAPAAKESSDLQKNLLASGFGGLTTAVALNVFNNAFNHLRRGRAIDDEVYLAAREPPVEPPVSKEAPAATEEKSKEPNPILLSGIGGTFSAGAISLLSHLNLWNRTIDDDIYLAARAGVEGEAAAGAKSGEIRSELDLGLEARAGSLGAAEAAGKSATKSGGLGAILRDGAISAGAFTLFSTLIRREPEFADLVSRELAARLEPPRTSTGSIADADGPAPTPPGAAKLSVPKAAGLTGLGLTAGAASIATPMFVAYHHRDLDADTLRLLLGRDLEDLFARSFGIDEFD